MSERYYACPSCDDGSLQPGNGIELSHDDWDEYTFIDRACDCCAFRGASLYMESRRGALDSEVWRIAIYRVQAHAELARMIATCPAKSDCRCKCEAHRLFEARDARGNPLALRLLEPVAERG